MSGPDSENHPSPTADVPLGVLDLVPVSAGESIADALGNTTALARRADQLGYRRYWITEHHLNASTAGLSATLLTALVAAATSHIRVGSATLQLGHRTGLSVAEEWGLLDALYPGRLDLGLGRAGWHPPEPAPTDDAVQAPASQRRLRGSNLFALHRQLLPRHNATSPDYHNQVAEVAGLLAGTHRVGDLLVAAVPAHRAQVQLWVLGRTASESAQVAGALGLPFATNHHASPATTMEAIDAYRAAFRPSPTLSRPYVVITADVVVGPDEQSARRAAVGHDVWTLANRTGAPTVFPTPQQAEAHTWTAPDRELVADLGQARLIGSARQVADGLRGLRDRFDADELLAVTTTFAHADRLRSYELLAEQWQF
ncbi:MsnO8 family LLM class oxidoreductase [Frankia sp. AgPm24]|uniref:MsnO8 family LLM class oxidoreductase n=1 Tax=Frankia umida TaxID=573489 RepID=A0ABT0K2N0_9ACTN|nr:MULTISPECIES: MsnO8 family LLM class oxidoreductase [Frankia]MCK9878038.1 MsnO8 family LLM class oxidoreductase [Frankia umida]MCK9925113.1 MsnO8 family LLM class oxidoreductase [Frankia sp. AgPm24]